MILRNCTDVPVIGQAGSFGIHREAIGDQSMRVGDREFGAPVSLGNLIHNHVPILPPMKVRQQHQSRVGDEQDFAILRRVLQMLNDVSNDPIAGLAVDRSNSNFGCQTGEVS
jgi:hypothetical protein